MTRRRMGAGWGLAVVSAGLVCLFVLVEPLRNTLPLRLQTPQSLARLCVQGSPKFTEYGVAYPAQQHADTTWSMDGGEQAFGRRSALACEAACARGVLGPGGCATVGEYLTYFGRFGIPDEGPMIDCGLAKAIPHLARACEDGYGADCLLAGRTAAWIGLSCVDVPPAAPFFERGCASGIKRSCDDLVAARRRDAAAARMNEARERARRSPMH